VLAEEDVLALVYEALAKRRRLSRTRGRNATPAEVVLRLLVLKHIRSWSYATLEREVRTCAQEALQHLQRRTVRPVQSRYRKMKGLLTHVLDGWSWNNRRPFWKGRDN
jgi:hypothetical protein